VTGQPLTEVRAVFGGDQIAVGGDDERQGIGNFFKALPHHILMVFTDIGDDGDIAAHQQVLRGNLIARVQGHGFKDDGFGLFVGVLINNI